MLADVDELSLLTAHPPSCISMDPLTAPVQGVGAAWDSRKCLCHGRSGSGWDFRSLATQTPLCFYKSAGKELLFSLEEVQMGGKGESLFKVEREATQASMQNSFLEHLCIKYIYPNCCSQSFPAECSAVQIPTKAQ